MGKKQPDANGLEVKRLQVELTEACKVRAVDRVLQVFKQWEAAQAVLPRGCFPQALSVLVECDSADASEATLAEHWEHAKHIFARACLDIRDWSSIGESVFTLMVRLAARAVGPAVAREYLEQMRRPPVSIKPKLRTFIPILEACARGGLSDEAEALYRNELFSCCGPSEDTAIWTTDMEDRLWQSVFALRLRALAACATRGGLEEAKSRTEAILADLRSVCPQLRPDTGLVEALREAFSALGWRTEVVEIGPDAVCPATRATLQPVHCSRKELVALLSLIERLAIEQASPKAVDEWGDFKAWLGRVGHAWDMVIDGANVGHHNQNCAQGAFSHMQIQEVISQCSQAGRQRIAVVLRERWVDPEADFAIQSHKRKRRKLPPLVLKAAPDSVEDAPMPAADAAAAAETAAAPSGTPVEPPYAALGSRSAEAVEALTEAQRRIADLAEDWRRRGILVASPPSIDDDWVALYIAVAMSLQGSDVQLVTNDIFRDHFFRMRQPPAFKTFCERHLTRYHILIERPELNGPPLDDTEARIRNTQLFPPPMYSNYVQRHSSGCWHFPVRLAEPLVPTDAGEEVRVEVGDPRWEWLVAWDPETKEAAG